MDNSKTQLSKARGVISELLVKSKRNKQLTILLLSVAMTLLSGAIIHLFLTNHQTIFLLMLLVFFSSVIFQLNSIAYKNLNEQRVIEHINSLFPEFQESSQLILKTSPNSVLQQLQTKKIEVLLLQQSVQVRLQNSLQGIQFKLSLILLVMALAVYFASRILSTGNFISPQNQPRLTEQELSGIAALPQLISSKIIVTAPEYTGLLPVTISELELKIIEGTLIHWQLGFSDKDVEYFMVGVDGNKTAIALSEDGYYHYSNNYAQTGLYRIVYQQQDSFKPLGDVHTIEVTLDELPRIKIIEPKQSLVELAKDSNGSFNLQVQVDDDYGINSTKIIASVASGSGEAVKFRDAVFNFDTATETGSTKVYKKHWLLTELKMEPGDEVYFKVVVEDNKQPIPQQVKSSSVIVRWLDEQAVETVAEGLRINFIPEYFRSQRQIIIETEQLIADRKDLPSEKIEEISRDIGYSQSDLKTKYGQYLGDEIGEGPGEQFGLADGYHGGENNSAAEVSHDDEDDDHEDDKPGEGAPEIGHLHEEMLDSTDASGRSELIARFAHNHGGTEIGPISKQDPKSWMKLAVNEMWQAELHLMLSQPEQALEFEYKAYDYLKLATQAERIYVKRLGFEPPPVNEDTRLTGELEDILSYSLSIDDSLDEGADGALIQQVFLILSGNPEKNLNQNQMGLLKQLKHRILQLSESRPALIKQAATIERILTENKISIKSCDDCINQLKQKLWQLMPAAISKPQLRETAIDTEMDYQQQIQLLKNNPLFNGVKND